MKLNTLSPALGHKTEKKRVGRGIGSGLGKTCGKGHKGQKARKSGNVRPGFEGGQMPLQKRLPKYGFTSRISRESAEIRTYQLGAITSEVVDLPLLKSLGLVGQHVKKVKIFLSGSVDKKINIKGLSVTAGARKAIESFGGIIEE